MKITKGGSKYKYNHKYHNLLRIEAEQENIHLKLTMQCLEQEHRELKSEIQEKNDMILNLQSCIRNQANVIQQQQQKQYLSCLNATREKTENDVDLESIKTSTSSPSSSPSPSPSPLPISITDDNNVTNYDYSVNKDDVDVNLQQKQKELPHLKSTSSLSLDNILIENYNNISCQELKDGNNTSLTIQNNNNTENIDLIYNVDNNCY